MRTVTDADALIAAMAPRLRRLRFAVGGEVDSRGAPGSMEWFQNYGYGPEHLFLNANLPQPAPISGAPPPGPSRGGSSGGVLGGVLGLLGTLGAGRSLENALRGQRGSTGDLQGMADVERGAADTSGTNAWIDQDLANLPMPTADFGEPDFWDQMHAGASDTSATDAWVNRELDDYAANMPMPTLDDQAPWTQRLGQGVRGSIGLLGGAAQGGTGGAGNMLRGGSDLYEATLGPSAMSGRVGNVGGVLAGIDEGGVEGYGSAAVNAAELADSLGYGGALGGIGKGAPVIGGLSDIYGGLQRGDARGYLQAASGAVQTGQALGSLTGSASALSGAGGALSAAGKALPLVGGALSAYDAYNAAAVGDKKGAVMSGAQAGAAIGSVIPVIGTAVGAVIGAAVGLIGASLGNKENPSEIAYGAHKKQDASASIRGWSEDQANGAMFEAIKSHTKSGNINRFKDVSEMFTAFGITKDAHKNYKNAQDQMSQFIRGVIETAQQSGGLPTDPAQLRNVDGQQLYYKVVVPAMAAKFEEATGQPAQGWKVDHSQGDSALQNIFADYTDYVLSHWGDEKKAPLSALPGGGGSRARGAVQKKARGGALTTVYGR